VTAFGQVIDPLADKLLISAALISLVQLELATAWMVAIIIGREFAVTGLRSLAYARGVVIPASPLGKIKMVAEVVAILALILSRTGNGEMSGLYAVGQGALWVVMAAALISAADYFRRFNGVLSPRVADISVAREQRTDRKAG
jgi:CDP-diacylglycerol--glycerol-3-phosphate 3-phosphatidyltransferase